MAKILITLERVLNYSGSELVAFDLARYLVSKGNSVTVATTYVHPRFGRVLSEVGISLFTIESGTGLHISHFDIIWAHHYHILDICLLDLKITGDKILFSSLSPFVPDECPPTYASDLTLILTNSQENKDKVISYGYESSFIYVLPNPVPDSVFNLQKNLGNNHLKKIGIVTNHLCSELSEAIDIIQNTAGVVVNIYGIDHNYCLVTPDLLMQYDLIVTIGRTVQHCIVLGIPLYCYDHFGGPGYLSAENFAQAEYFNFSGRCTGKKSASQICSEISNNYEQALSDICLITASTRERYRLSYHVDYLLSEISTLPKLNFESMGTFQQAFRRRNRQQTQLYNNCSAELYWLEGTDEYYSEHQKVSVRYCFDQGDIALRFVFPDQVSNVRALRLDIIDKPGSFLINEIHLEDMNSNIRWVWDKVTAIFDDLSPDIIKIPTCSNSGTAQFAAIGLDPFFRINLDNEVLKNISSNFQLMVSFKTSDLSKIVINLKEELDSLKTISNDTQVDHPCVNGSVPYPSLTLMSDLEEVTMLITQTLSSRDQALVSKTFQLNLMREELNRAEAQLDLLKDVLIHNLDEGK
jgi:hypothetical protein